MNALLLTLMVEQASGGRARWARWARDEVEGWSDTTTPTRRWAVRAIRQVLDGEPVSDAP